MNYRYEVLILTVPEITQDETKQLESELDRFMTKSKGSIISFERWGKFKLTYPIRSNAYGVYFLVRFELPATDVKELNELFTIKFHTIVMRHLISRLEGDSLAYQRPKSLEEAPASRDMDSFLKDNQMEGLFAGDEKERDRRGMPARRAMPAKKAVQEEFTDEMHASE
jgi:small subunit ribosomal protein S6